MLFKNIAHDRDPKFIIYLVLVLFIFRSSSMNVCIRSLEFLTELIVWGVTKLLHVCSTSIPLKHHPPHQVPVLRKVSPLLRIYTKLKFKKVCHSYFCSFLWLLRPIPRSKWPFFVPLARHRWLPVIWPWQIQSMVKEWLPWQMQCLSF